MPLRIVVFTAGLIAAGAFAAQAQPVGKDVAQTGRAAGHTVADAGRSVGHATAKTARHVSHGAHRAVQLHHTHTQKHPAGA